MAKQRYDSLQLDRALVYLIDNVTADALPYLAEQFDVLGYKGMKLAANVAQQREVIKRAIELHRFKGTLWAVREALKNIGYPNAIITEKVNILSDPDHGWATFRVQIDGGSNAISAAQISELVQMIEEYKNARSQLLDISYTLVFDDGVTIGDSSFENPSVDDGDTLNVGSNFIYNGAVPYDGSRNFSPDNDVLTVTII
jgi:phage tail P2-like protein